MGCRLGSEAQWHRGTSISTELSKPIDSPGPRPCYNLEASCFVDDELRPCLGPGEQEGSTSLIQDYPHSAYHSHAPSPDRNVSEGPTSHFRPEPLDGRGRLRQRMFGGFTSRCMVGGSRRSLPLLLGFEVANLLFKAFPINTHNNFDLLSYFQPWVAGGG